MTISSTAGRSPRFFPRIGKVAAGVLAGLLAAGSALFLASPAHAAEVSTVVDGMTFTADNGDVDAGTIVTDFDGSSTTVTIRSTVTIPDAVTIIGYRAFADNSGLTTVTFQGPPPTRLTAAGTGGSLGDGIGLVVSYPFECDAANYPCGYTTPTWQGYTRTTTIPPLTVTFDSAGGSTVADQTVDCGDPATQPTAPTRTGYDLTGWYTDGSPWDFTQPVTENTTLTAHWTAVAVPAGTTSRLANTGSGLGVWPLAGLALILAGLGGLALHRRGRQLPHRN